MNADEAEALAWELAAELSEAGVAFVDAVEDLAGPAATLAAVDARYRAALHVAGLSDRRAPARELAVDALHARLEPLRPYLPAVTGESGARAASALAGPPSIVTAK